MSTHANRTLYNTLIIKRVLIHSLYRLNEFRRGLLSSLFRYINCIATLFLSLYNIQIDLFNLLYIIMRIMQR